MLTILSPTSISSANAVRPLLVATNNLFGYVLLNAQIIAVVREFSANILQRRGHVRKSGLVELQERGHITRRSPVPGHLLKAERLMARDN